MKNIQTILEELQIDLSDETRDALVKSVNENYRTIAEVQAKSEKLEKQAEQIEQLTAQANELAEQAQALEGSTETIENLKKQIAEYNEAEEQRTATEAENKKRADFKELFDAACDGRSFANDLIASSIFEKAYSACSSKTGANVADVLHELTDGIDGVWKNPQQAAEYMPTGTVGKQSADDQKRSFAQQLAAAMRS